MGRPSRGLTRQTSSLPSASAPPSHSPDAQVPSPPATTTTSTATTQSYLSTSYLPTSFSRLFTTAAPSPPPATTAYDSLAAIADALLGPVSAPAPTVPLAPNDALVRRMHESPRSRTVVLHQFLRARHGDPVAAGAMLRDALAWRRSVGIARFLRDADELVADPRAGFPMRKVTCGGTAARDMVVYGLPRLMDKNVVQKECFLEATTAWLESLFDDTEYERERINAILDFGGWSLRKHAPYVSAKAGINLLNNYYPDRLGTVFCVRYPSTIRAAYNVIRPLLDSGAREKIVFVSSADPRAFLREKLGEESLPVFCGGKLHIDFGPDIDLAKEWQDEFDSHATLATTSSS